METKQTLRAKRKLRVRAKVSGTAKRSRLSIFRSNRALLAQLIDDDTGTTLVSLRVLGKNIRAGHLLGTEIAKLALQKNIKKVVFDRSGYRYHGVVKEIADTSREGGLVF